MADDLVSDPASAFTTLSSMCYYNGSHPMEVEPVLVARR